MKFKLLILMLGLLVASIFGWPPKAGVAANMIISDYYYKNSYGRGAGTIPETKKSINGGVGHAPVALNKDRGPGVMPKYDSYGRGVGTPGIDEQQVRTKKGNVSGSCSGDYPKHIGARCYRQDICSKRKKDSYSFDGTSRCNRNKAISQGTPSSYPTPSKAETLGCPSGTQIIAGGCFQNCPSGWKDQTVRAQPGCEGPKHGSCPSGKNKSGALCYPECRAGFHPDGLFCYADNKELCGSDRILEDGLCYKRCPDGYKGHATMCTQVLADQCASTEEMDAGLCYKKCSIRSAKYPNRNGARCYQTGATCKKGEENQNGLCYKKCRKGYAAEGPVCWGQTPPGYMKCGAGFSRNKWTCGFVTADQVLAAAQLGVAAYGATDAAKASRNTKALTRAIKLNSGAAVDSVKALDASLDMMKGLVKGGFKPLDAMTIIGDKAFVPLIKNLVKTADAAKAGKSVLSPRTLADLHRMFKSGPVKELRKRLWTLAGLGKTATSKKGAEPPPVANDPYAITRTAAELFSLGFAIADASCTLFKYPAGCEGPLKTFEPAALVTDVIAAYVHPIYGTKK